MKARRLVFVLMGRFLKLSRRKKIAAVFMTLFALLTLFLVTGYISGAVLKPFKELQGESHSLLYYGILSYPGLMITALLWSVMIIAVLLSGSGRDLKNTAVSQDETGMILMEKSTFGDAHFMTEQETRQILRVSLEKDTETTVYGQLTDNGEKVISFKPNSEGATGNFNEAVIGGSGSGKSSCYVIMKVIKSIQRNESIVVTDPKGELYRLTAYYAKNHGYKVQILNMKYPKWTDCWDCLAEVIDPETGRLDSTALNDFVNIYMKNSSEGKEEPFFYNNAAALLKAAIGYCAYMREDTILEGLRDLYEMIAKDEPDCEEKTAQISADISFDVCETMILEATERSRYRMEDVIGALHMIYENAPLFTIAQVYHTIVQFDNEIKMGSGKKTIFDQMPNDHPGKMAYDAFRRNTKESVKGGAEQGIMQRFSLFTDKYLRTILSNDGIRISEIRKKKTIVYVIVDDTPSGATTKPIVSLFFSFLLKDCQKQWDSAENEIDDENAEVPLLPVTIILDELYSCGVIGSEEKTLPQTLSVARSKRMNFGLILQGYDQLMDIYGESNRNNILGQCSTKLFFGRVDDDATRIWISSMTGEATVMNESHVESLGLALPFQNAEQVNASAAKRYLLTPAQVAKWKDEVLFFKGGEVGRYNTFHWKDSEEYRSGEMKQTSFKKEYRSLDQIGISDEKSFVVDPFRQKDFSTKSVASESRAVYRKVINALQPEPISGSPSLKSVRTGFGEQLEMSFNDPSQWTDEAVFELEDTDMTEEIPVLELEDYGDLDEIKESIEENEEMNSEDNRDRDAAAFSLISDSRSASKRRKRTASDKKKEREIERKESGNEMLE